ncbi:MAG: ATP-binding cassette domain-containing protein [Pseudomonadota bacterium]
MILNAKDISVVIPSREKPILQTTNITIESGEFVVVLGANGSGKSTLIKTLSGEITATSGDILLDGIPITQLPTSQKAIDFVTLSQNAESRLFVELTLQENIALWESRSKSRAMGRQPLPEKFNAYMHQKLSQFSGGEKQAILLHLALSIPPKILFLDEHTSALDHKAADTIMALTAKQVAEHSITTLMVTHNLEDALRYGSRVVVMHEGRILHDQKKNTNLSLKEIKEMVFN